LRRKLDTKCDGGGAEKIRRRLDWSVDDFDSMEIRLGKSAKFDSTGSSSTCKVKEETQIVRNRLSDIADTQHRPIVSGLSQHYILTYICSTCRR